MRRLPLREADATRVDGRAARRLHELPHAARASGRGGCVRELPRRDPRRPRGQDGVHRMPRAALGESERAREHVHVVPSKDRDERQGGARGRRRMRGLSPGTRLCRARKGAALRDVPHERGRARRDEQGAQRLRELPRRIDAQADQRTRLRDVPQDRGRERAAWASEVRRVPSTALRSAHGANRMRVVPRERDQGSARERQRRVRIVSPRPRTERDRQPASLRELSSARDAARAPRRRVARDVLAVPLVARAAAQRSRDVHRIVPREQARSPTAGADLHGVPRLPQVTARGVT